MNDEQRETVRDGLNELFGKPKRTLGEALKYNAARKISDAQTRHPELSGIMHTVSASLEGRGNAQGLALLTVPLVLEECEGLDDVAVTNGLWAGYAKRFLASMHDSSAAEACRQVASFAGDGFKIRGGENPSMDELFIRGLSLSIRRSLRIGHKAEDLLMRLSDEVEEMAVRGDVRFFISLGESLKEHRNKPFTRSIESLIRNAWLPLALWQCDAKECEKRLSAWWEVLAAQGAAMPKLPSPKSLDAVLRRVRAALKAGRR